jgi:hypothetical protein
MFQKSNANQKGDSKWFQIISELILLVFQTLADFEVHIRNSFNEEE